MAGQIRVMIDRIVADRSRGNPTLVATTTTKLILKGFDPEAYTLASPDDPQAIARLRAIATDLNVTL